MAIQTGTISLHPRGFGFVVQDDPTQPAAFVKPPDLNSFFSKDRVKATITESSPGRFTATNLELINRPRATVFGQVTTHRGVAYLRIDREISNTDWPLLPSNHIPILPPEGSFCIARIQDSNLLCEQLLPPQADPPLEQILARYEIRTQFSDNLLHDADSIINPVLETTRPRRDLRELPTVTVDAASTRDIDDAISVIAADSDGALRLLVSIADVTAAISPASPLDLEAKARATSVYLPDRVLPMLPESISEKSLSLLPNQDRACLTVELRINPEGEVLSTDIYRSLIRSTARLTYDEVALFLDQSQVTPQTSLVAPLLSWCRTAFARLSMARAQRGGVQISRDEVRIIIDSRTGKATSVEPVHATSAHEMIERFMVAANEAVAAWLQERGVPAPFRVHDEPSAEAIDRLAKVSANFGFQPGFGNRLSPRALGAFDRQIRAAHCAPAILSVLSRALGPALYTVHDGPHFGLAAKHYLHFTSPIRRYADILVHRAVTGYLDGDRPKDPRNPALEELCGHINERARLADKAERDARKLAAARYLSSKVGEFFESNIIGIRPLGLLVQLVDSLIVGNLSAEDLPDGPYQAQESSLSLVGPNRNFSVGMPLRVRLTRVDEIQGKLEFSLA